MNRATQANMHLARLFDHKAILAERGEKTTHLLLILPAGSDWHDAPEQASAQAALKRRGKKADELAKQALTVELPGG